MSIVTVTKRWLASRPTPSAEAQADLALIAKARTQAEFDDRCGDIRDALQDERMGRQRHEALHAELRRLYRERGFSDDLVYDCGVLRRKPE